MVEIMVNAPKAIVKPAVLEWLRLASGLSLEDAAHKIQTKPEKLAAWETGRAQPSMPQLRKLAKAFKRPINYFYLPHPFEEPAIPHDFRRLPDVGVQRPSPALVHEIRMAYQRRSITLDLAREMGIDLLPFDAFDSVTLTDNPENVAEMLRNIVGVRFTEQSSWRDARKSYLGWRQRIEALGVLVFQVISVEMQEMLGFSLAYRELPVIALNRKNAVNGRTFTMLHEFVHLLLGEGGLCDIDDKLPRAPKEQRVEVFCNHVAGAALVPRMELLAHRLMTAGGNQPRDWGDETIAAIARDFGCSEHVVLRRLLTTNRTTPAFYARKSAEYAARFEKLKQRKREKPAREFRRNMAREAVSNLSFFAKLVLDSYHSDHINLSEASKYLGVRAEKVATVETMVR